MFHIVKFKVSDTKLKLKLKLCKFYMTKIMFKVRFRINANKKSALFRERITNLCMSAFTLPSFDFRLPAPSSHFNFYVNS